MAKKKEEVIEVINPEPEVKRPLPSKIEFNFGNGDMNVLRNKLNEVIDWLDN